MKEKGIANVIKIDLRKTDRRDYKATSNSKEEAERNNVTDDKTAKSNHPGNRKPQERKIGVQLPSQKKRGKLTEKEVFSNL